MNDNYFIQEILGGFPIDEEYDALLNLWYEYRLEAEFLERKGQKVTFQLHKKYFPYYPFQYNKKKYQRAKMESLKVRFR